MPDHGATEDGFENALIGLPKVLGQGLGSKALEGLIHVCVETCRNITAGPGIGYTEKTLGTKKNELPRRQASPVQQRSRS